MTLDLAPLELSHFLYFGGTFLAVFAVFWLLLTIYPQFLRPHPTIPQVYYGGVMVVGVCSLIAFFAQEDVVLRIGMLASAFVVLVVGIIDERLRLSPLQQLLWQLVIALIAVGWGGSIEEITRPWGSGVINLAGYRIGSLLLPGAFLTVAWLVFLMNAINWLDGSDGLAGGVGVVSLLTLGLVSLLPSIQDAETLTLAMIGAGGVLGFLVWNFPPAKVYLGTSGSWYLGLYIGLVAIMGGGKVVTTLLVLALPVIDVLVVIIQRLMAKQAPWRGDTIRHLHYRLQAAGYSQRFIALVGIGLSAVLGYSAITLQTNQKIIAFGIAAVMLVLVTGILVYRQSSSGLLIAKDQSTEPNK